jgi:hypothetical protein
MDLAIVLSTEQETYEASDRVYVSWVRPQTIHELLSSADGIFFASSQLDFDGTKQLKENMKTIHQLQLGDRILFKTKSVLMWEQGLISNLYNSEDNHYVDVKYFTDTGDSRVESIPLDIHFVSPLPVLTLREIHNRIQSESPTFTSNQSSSTTLLGRRTNDGRLYAETDDTSFNYARKRNSIDASDFDFNFSEKILMELGKFGVWEKYTKGVGTKVLSKMGYKRFVSHINNDGVGYIII